MSNITFAFSFVMILNVLMFMTQFAMIQANPDSTEFFNFKDSLMDNFDNGNSSNRQIDENTINQQLPSGEGSISPETGNYFTDIFSSIKTWIAERLGIKYFKSMALAPYLLLKAMNLPNAFCFAVGVLWYGCSLFVMILFLFGRD